MTISFAQTQILSKLRHLGCFYPLLPILPSMPHCKSTQLHPHHHDRLLYYFTTITNLTSQTERYPFEELNNALKECLFKRDIRMGRLVHTQLIRLNPTDSVSLWNKILSLYSNAKNIQHSRQLFETMPERDVVSFNTIMSAYLRHFHDVVEAIRLYVRMQEEGVIPNHITFCTIIGGLSTKHLIELIHAHLIRYGLSSNVFVGSSLVDAYSKRMRLDEGIRAFDEIADLDLVSWNVMIDGCVRNGNKDQAARMFFRMQQEVVLFDSFTLSSITKTCSEPRDLEWGMQLHCCIIKAGLACQTPVSNALITMYSKCEERMMSATYIFETTPAPNLITWTAMIAGFMQNGLSDEAIGFYQRMLRAGVNENEFSFASILPAYTSLATLEQGMQVHARIIKSVFGLDVGVGNALIDMYSKCGNLTDAQLVFTSMERRDVVSWTSMITGLGQHGQGQEALRAIKAMISEGMRPDAVTFLVGLCACSHGGLVNEGLQVFRSMIDVYRVNPRREHYSCIVDMLGRAGRLKEAEKFITEMGIESDALVWEALLGACTIHGEMELGEECAKNIMELDPKKHGPYVLLANMYADKGLWEDKDKMRERLTMGGLKKEAGSSCLPVQCNLPVRDQKR